MIRVRQEAIYERRVFEASGRHASPCRSRSDCRSPDTQRGLVRTLRLGTVVILVSVVTTLDTGAISSAAAMLAITSVPTLLRRRYDVPFDSGLVLCITVVVFLRAIGSFYIYDRSFWWHNLSHPLSATLVGAGGYVAIRTLDEHRDDIHLARN